MTFRFPSLAQETARVGYTKAQAFFDGTGLAPAPIAAVTDAPWEVRWYFYVTAGVIVVLRIACLYLDWQRKRRGRP